jgi:hypothetical protein
MQLILDGQIQARIDSHNKVHNLLIFWSFSPIRACSTNGGEEECI